MSEIRIYYEVIEQANHYIRPILEEYLSSFDSSIEIKMVRQRSSYTSYAEQVAPIIFWKDPDIMLTVVEDGREIPLLMLEFSTAVFTEDHELQRYDGPVTAAANECPFVKISPTEKESSSGHGGNTEFDHLTPYAIIYENYEQYPIHVNWPVDDSGTSVQTDDRYPSCPPKLGRLNDILRELAQTVEREHIGEGWANEFYTRLRGQEWFDMWANELETHETPDKNDIKLESKRNYVEHIDGMDRLVLKFNRFGHAMDPERGMLSHRYHIDPNIVSTMIFDENNRAWYKSTPREDAIDDYISTNGLDERKDFLQAFRLASRLYEYDAFEAIVDSYDGEYEIDLSEVASQNYENINKALRTIFVFSNGFIIQDSSGENRLKFTWSDFSESMVFSNYPDVTPLHRREALSEDDVTYLVAHSVLRQNGFEIVSISYPGAQGDDAILIEPSEGRRQKRKYIDVVSKKSGEVLNLEESKGKFSPRRVQSDIDDLRKYKSKDDYQAALEVFKEKSQIHTPAGELLLGVGFWANKRFDLSDAKDLELRDLDYFIYIDHEGESWELWSKSGKGFLTEREGRVQLPETYGITD